MTRGQRRLHRLAWWALLPVLIAVLALAWSRRERTHGVFVQASAHGETLQ